MILKDLTSLVGVIFSLMLVGESSAYNFTCGRKGKEKKPLQKGDPVFFCIHFMPYMVKLGFPLTVDEYTGLEVPGSFELFEEKSPEQTKIFGQFDIYEIYSPAAVYMVKSTKTVVNIMHLVIKLEEGNFAGYRWDNDCYGCNNTDACKAFTTTYENHSGKEETTSYSVCTRSYPVFGNEKKLANLKVDC